MKKIIKLSSGPAPKIVCMPDLGSMAKTFADHIYNCTHTNHDKEEESHRPEIEVRYHDGSSIYFKIFDDGKVGFRTTETEKENGN